MGHTRFKISHNGRKGSIHDSSESALIAAKHAQNGQFFRCKYFKSLSANTPVYHGAYNNGAYYANNRGGAYSYDHTGAAYGARGGSASWSAKGYRGGSVSWSRR